jgi:2-octaprenyl-6-methoxyphenol hydroxylase
MERADVLILGGGLVGLTLALALDRHGVTSIVVDAAEPASQVAPAFDGRATAVSSTSWRLLQAIGVAARLEGAGCPIRAIRVSDGLDPGSLTFDPRTEGNDIDDPLGIMVENRLLRHALQQEAAAAAGVTILAPAHAAEVIRDEVGVRAALADGRLVTAALLVGAEGRQSPTRDAAQIPVARWRYDHAAMVTTVRHERPHENVAYEIFYPDGPFAILPMLDDEEGPRSAIVWSVSAADGPAYMSLSDRAFAAEVEKKMGGFLGPVRLAGRRWSHPLGFHHAARITDLRLALVGDAAHGIHPIAGQGLNLGLRDAAALAEVLVEGSRLGLALGDAQLLARYQSWRSLDTFSVALATDSLTRIYGLRGRAPSAVRRFGMTLIDRIGPLKDRLMAEARGESGALPLLLRGLPI